MSETPSIDSFAARQRGLITSAQLKKCKVPASTKTDWIVAGRLVVVHDGVYRLGGAPMSFEQSCLAATLAGAPDCFADARSAIQLWGFCRFDDEFIDVVVKRSRLPRLKGVHVHRSRDLDKFFMTKRHGIPIVPPTLALLDAAAVVEIDVIREAMEQAFVSKLVTPGGLRTAYELVARPGRRGAGVIRGLLEGRALGDDIADAKSEVLFAGMCKRFRLPKPVFHCKVFGDDGRFIAEPDFAYPDRKVAIEVDSVSVHGTAGALQSDLERQNRLINAGWIVLRFTWHDLKFRPEYVAQTIRECLGASQPLFRL